MTTARGSRLRTGVNTGEVVTGTEERLATGDAVNVAARLEQAAAPGEMLLGPETMRLASRRGDRPRRWRRSQLKGKAERVAALSPRSPSTPRSFRADSDAPLVGRQRELRLLARCVGARRVTERTCMLFTLLGAAGVGKSRLDARSSWADTDATVAASAAASPTARASPTGPSRRSSSSSRSLRPRCELRPARRRSSARRPPRPRPRRSRSRSASLLELPALAGSAARRSSTTSTGESRHSSTSIEHAAHDEPWAHRFSCSVSARPELLDRRPSWGGGLLNATTVLLEPLSADETDELIGSLGTPASDDGSGRADPRRGRGEPAVRRGDGSRWSRRAATRRGRRAPDGARAPRRATRPARRRASVVCSSAARSRARCSTAARSRLSVPRDSDAAARLPLVRKELVRPDTPRVRRRRRVSLPPHPDPRRGLRRVAEGDSRRAARAVRRAGSTHTARI